MNGFEILALVVWLFPIFVLCCIIYGYLRNRFFWHQNPNLTSKIIIQITTLNNYDIVNRNIATIKSYDLCIPYEIWIVTESSLVNRYYGADKILRRFLRICIKGKIQSKSIRLFLQG